MAIVALLISQPLPGLLVSQPLGAIVTAFALVGAVAAAALAGKLWARRLMFYYVGWTVLTSVILLFPGPIRGHEIAWASSIVNLALALATGWILRRDKPAPAASAA